MYSTSSDNMALGYALGRDSDGNRNDGFFGGDGWWAIILFAMIFGWGNGGWGGWGNGANGAALQGALTRGDLCSEFSFNDLQNGVRGLSNGICDSTFALNNTVVNGFNGVARDMCTGFAAINSGINENRFANQQCCCNIERAIDNSRFDTQTGFNAIGQQISSCCCDIRSGLKDIQFQNATDTCALQTTMLNNTRDIIESQQAGTRAVIDWLCAKETADLRAENQSLRLAASQEKQNNTLINALRPSPVPAYPACTIGGYGYGYGYGAYGFNGYNGYGYNNNGCNCGCGCNNGCGCN